MGKEESGNCFQDDFVSDLFLSFRVLPFLKVIIIQENKQIVKEVVFPLLTRRKTWRSTLFTKDPS